MKFIEQDRRTCPCSASIKIEITHKSQRKWMSSSVKGFVKRHRIHALKRGLISLTP